MPDFAYRWGFDASVVAAPRRVFHVHATLVRPGTPGSALGRIDATRRSTAGLRTGHPLRMMRSHTGSGRLQRSYGCRGGGACTGPL